MSFYPEHIDLTPLEAENRIFLIPGSNGRSQYIADKYLDKESLVIHPSSRNHNVYLGLLQDSQIKIGIVSTGMGCPSLDIIATELIQLGVKTLIRVGTCGSLNIAKVPLGSVFIGTSAVRDETTSANYVVSEFPAVADLDWVSRLVNTAKTQNIIYHTGIIHTKDSLYSREFQLGPMGEESKRYLEMIENAGARVSEMESSHLFILGSVYGVATSSVLAVIGGGNDPFGLPEEAKQQTLDKAIELTFEAIRKNLGH